MEQALDGVAIILPRKQWQVLLLPSIKRSVGTYFKYLLTEMVILW
jgi:hypothetical protein